MKSKIPLLFLFTFSILHLPSSIFAQGIWTKKKDKPGNATHEMGAFTLNGKGYVCGGAIAYPNWSNETWEYDPNTDTWAQKANFPVTGLREPAFFAINGKGYAGTGMTGSATVKTFYEFDPVANTWTAKTNFMGTARRDAVGFAIGNKGYMGTGVDAAGGTKDIYEYDPALNSWIKKTDFGGVVRNAATSFAIGTKGYITTGRQGTPTYNDLWEYDPTGNAWTQKANYGGTARSECVSFVLNGKGYVGLGHTGNGGPTDFWAYDPAANSWGTVTPFPGTGTERFESVGFEIGNKGYICGGIIQGAGGQLDLWEYDPQAVGINENTETVNFSIYPNPSKGKFSIRSLDPISGLEIYNLQGEKVHTSASNATQALIDLSANQNGIYLVKVVSGFGNRTGTQKIILQK